MICEIVRDLIPIYADGACCEQTQKMVEEHITFCPKCQEYYKSYKGGEKRNIIFFDGKKFLKSKKTLGDYKTDIPEIDCQFALLSSKLKKRKLKIALITIGVLCAMATYIVIDIVNVIKKKQNDQK